MRAACDPRHSLSTSTRSFRVHYGTACCHLLPPRTHAADCCGTPLEKPGGIPHTHAHAHAHTLRCESQRGFEPGSCPPLDPPGTIEHVVALRHVVALVGCSRESSPRRTHSRFSGFWTWVVQIWVPFKYFQRFCFLESKNLCAGILGRDSRQGKGSIRDRLVFGVKGYDSCIEGAVTLVLAISHLQPGWRLFPGPARPPVSGSTADVVRPGSFVLFLVLPSPAPAGEVLEGREDDDDDAVWRAREPPEGRRRASAKQRRPQRSVSLPRTLRARRCPADSLHVLLSPLLSTILLLAAVLRGDGSPPCAFERRMNANCEESDA